MIKFLVSILCSIPLIVNATTVGGFEFNKDDIIGQIPADGCTVLRYETRDGKHWIGMHHNKSHFRLWTRARGKNKAWNLFSAEKGKYLISEDKARSILILTEYDCREGKARTLKTIAFTGYFRTGDVINISDSSQNWEYVEDSDLNMILGCKNSN